jgi:acetyl esterase/lipase
MWQFVKCHSVGQTRRNLGMGGDFGGVRDGNPNPHKLGFIKNSVMLRRIRNIVVVLLCLAAAASGNAPTLYKDPQFRIKVERGIQYFSAPVGQPSGAHRALLLDLYQPDEPGSAAKRPALIAIHGGGFLLGDRAEMTSLCREMAARGYVCASIDYRLLTDDPPGKEKQQYTRTVMASVEDAAQAAKWMVRNAAKYHIDSTKLLMGGSSAGAVISMLYAYAPAALGPRVRAVADMWGTMGPRVNWIRKGGPPLFIVHGTEDETITVSAARQIDARAKQVGLPHETYIVSGMGHGIPLNLEIKGETLLQHVVDFFYAQLGT